VHQVGKECIVNCGCCFEAGVWIYCILYVFSYPFGGVYTM